METKINTDKEGNVYFTSYGGTTNAVMMYGGVNTLFEGKLKTVARIGKSSKFGNEIIFEFLISKTKEQYKTNSEKQYDNFEVYYPLETYIKHLDETLDYLKRMLVIR